MTLNIIVGTYTFLHCDQNTIASPFAIFRPGRSSGLVSLVPVEQEANAVRLEVCVVRDFVRSRDFARARRQSADILLDRLPCNLASDYRSNCSTILQVRTKSTLKEWCWKGWQKQVVKTCFADALYVMIYTTLQI